MNLLPKKSWHVGKKENIERVFRDELDARIIGEKTVHKNLAREKEEKLQQLRSKRNIPVDKPQCNQESFEKESGQVDSKMRSHPLEKHVNIHAKHLRDITTPVSNSCEKSDRFELFGEYEKAFLRGGEPTTNIKKSDAEKLKDKFQANSQSAKFSEVVSMQGRQFNPFSLDKFTKDTTRNIPEKLERSKRRSQLDREDPLAIMPKKFHR